MRGGTCLVFLFFRVLGGARPSFRDTPLIETRRGGPTTNSRADQHLEEDAKLRNSGAASVLSLRGERAEPELEDEEVPAEGRIYGAGRVSFQTDAGGTSSAVSADSPEASWEPPGAEPPDSTRSSEEGMIPSGRAVGRGLSSSTLQQVVEYGAAEGPQGRLSDDPGAFRGEVVLPARATTTDPAKKLATVLPAAAAAVPAAAAAAGRTVASLSALNPFFGFFHGTARSDGRTEEVRTTTADGRTADGRAEEYDYEDEEPPENDQTIKAAPTSPSSTTAEHDSRKITRPSPDAASVLLLTAAITKGLPVMLRAGKKAGPLRYCAVSPSAADIRCRKSSLGATRFRARVRPSVDGSLQLILQNRRNGQYCRTVGSRDRVDQ